MIYILALDQRTTNSRAIVFNVAQEITSVSQQAFPRIFPQPGFVEHEPRALRARWSNEILGTSAWAASDPGT